MTARLILQTLLMLVVTAGFLFGFGGDWRWPQAWVLLAEMGALGLAVGFWLQKYDPALLRQRMTSPFDNENHQDRLFLAGFLLAIFGWLILIALDARFYEWSHAPRWVELIGFLLVAAIFTAALGLRAVREENLLRQELPGYAAYMGKVRFRLFPGIF